LGSESASKTKNKLVPVVSPFSDFFVRIGKLGLWILALIALYKMSDITMGVMANPFYLDLGFSKKEIADRQHSSLYIRRYKKHPLLRLTELLDSQTHTWLPLLLGILLRWTQYDRHQSFF
jgi:hypothetical protein